MSADAVVGNTHSHPYCSLASGAFAYHVHNPGFVGVGNGEALPFALIAIGLCQFGHYLNGLAGSLGTLKSKNHQRTIVDETADCVRQFRASAVGRLVNGQLELVHQSHYAIGMRHLGNLAQVVARLVVVERMHRSGRVVGCRDDAERFEGTVVVLAIGDDDAAVLRGFLAHNQVGAGP